jgi:hypothetical protein
VDVGVWWVGIYIYRVFVAVEYIYSYIEKFIYAQRIQLCSSPHVRPSHVASGRGGFPARDRHDGVREVDS